MKIFGIAVLSLFSIEMIAGLSASGTDGLSAHGMEFVELRAPLQALNGEVTTDGCRLRSLAGEEGGKARYFQVRAVALSDGSSKTDTGLELATTGRVLSLEDTVLWIRPGLTESYSASAEGLRQDFLVPERPRSSSGMLHVVLEVEGAQVQASREGARLVLEESGRELNYRRLMVTDAVGAQLPARISVDGEKRFRIIVDDSTATYPIRIDPTITDADWASFTSVRGVRGDVYALTTDSNGNVYIGGEFIVAGDELVNYITRWDGQRFTRVGEGLDRPVTAFAASGEDIYVCAHSEYITEGPAGLVLKWDGETWTTLGEGVNGPIYSFLFHEGDLYAGGRFSEIDGVEADNIAMWDGDDWSPVGDGMDERVYALIAFQGELHAGGNFSMAGESTAHGLARWDGSKWIGIPEFEEESQVRAMAVYKGDLHAAGRLKFEGDTTSLIARWDGGEWITISNGTISGTTAMVVVGSELFVNIDSPTINPGSDKYWIARWNGEEWTKSGTEITYVIRALAEHEGNVYAAGLDQDPAGFRNYRPAGIYHWDGTDWNTLGRGLDGPVSQIAVSGTDLYIAGDFTHVGDIDANRIAKWDGDKWSALGAGLITDRTRLNSIDSLIVNGSDVYVGGSFTRIQEEEAIRVEKWDGERWSVISEGITHFSIDIRALLHTGTVLYAGGEIGDYNNMARWDGNSWSELGAGPGGPVNDLVLLEGSLYASGPTIGVVRWNGSGWLPVGGDFNGTVQALGVSEGNLYATGSFTKIGNIDANHIAMWDGSSWTALGEGPNFSATALAVSGSDLFIGGNFSKVGELDTQRIAKWDGSSWSALGSGVGYFISDIEATPNSLFVAGTFSEAGGKAAPYLAVGLLGTPPVDVLSVTMMGAQLTILFRSMSGIEDWTIYGGPDLEGLPDNLMDSLSVVESSPGQYTAEIELESTLPASYFLQLRR